MKRKIKYTKGPEGQWRIVEDFLPSPERLILKEDKVKVTISLSKGSIDFFKKEAKRHNASYQKMIRKVIDAYASHYRRST
jgi:predicted DNA binding CopG/RHH family protein